MKSVLKRNSSSDEKVPSTPLPAEDDEFLQEFFGEVDRIQRLINSITTSTIEIKLLQDNILSSSNSESQKQFSSQLSSLLEKTGSNSKLAKRLLEGMNWETNKLAKEKSCSEGEIRIRKSAYRTCLQNLVVAIRQNENSQKDYKKKLEEKEVQIIKIIKPNATNEEIQGILQNQTDTTALVRESLLEPGRDIVNQVYLNTIDKYQDILVLEKSIVELHSMFESMAVLVEEQGLILDNIESNVIQTIETIRRGVNQIHRASKYRKQTRRRCCCLIGGLIVIIIIIVGPILSIL